MSIDVKIAIFDEGRLEARAFARLIERVESSARYATAITAIRIGNNFGFPNEVTQFASDRIIGHPESLFWIEEIHNGSKYVLGSILATTLLTTTLNNTIGVSIQDGWQRTKAHTAIANMVPRIEKLIIAEFRRLFERHGSGPSDYDFTIEPIAVTRERDENTISIRARPQRLKPSV